MKAIKAKQDFNVNGVYYFSGEVIEDKLPLDILVKLNEKGYIEPLSLKDITQYEKELNKPKKETKEVK